jgi:hypothetical protein
VNSTNATNGVDLMARLDHELASGKSSTRIAEVLSIDRVTVRRRKSALRRARCLGNLVARRDLLNGASA